MLGADLNEELARDRVARTLRESERKRLIREIEGPRKAWDGLRLATLAWVVVGLVVAWLT